VSPTGKSQQSSHYWSDIQIPVSTYKRPSPRLNQRGCTDFILTLPEYLREYLQHVEVPKVIETDKLKKSTIALMIWILMGCSSVYATPGTAYEDEMIEYLERGPATHLNINTHGRDSAEINKKLFQIYNSNNFHPFWIKDDKPNQQAKDILAALKNADSHGLNPSSYQLSKISQYWNSAGTADLVKLDILLTLGMLQYVADQSEGHLQPRLLDPQLFATASDVEVDWRSLLETAFKTPDMKSFLASQAPPFLQYRLLQKKLAEYRTIAAKGGWPSIPSGEVLKPGMVDPRVPILRKRLAVTGELQTENTESTLFDPELVDAVKKMQKRHNLSQDGIIGKQTLSAMNVPVEFRIKQIIINMERYRWLKRMNDEPMVAVNIAAFRAVAGRPGKFEISMPVIVGKTYHETPVFNDTIKYVEFNPYWNLPASIARTEILPKLQKDPDYLKKQKMRIFRGWDPDAPEVDARTIDWRKVSQKEMNRYRVRQDPGPKNALGTLKIMFPNVYDVYLHDTPAHGLFKAEDRAFSHGCIRMARPAEMAAWVLGGEAKGWSVERVNEIVATGKRQVVKLDTPMPIYILYRTAFVNQNEDDTLYFFNDVYGRDKLLFQALFDSNNELR
jgi:L,D-transpeptidase YcbB